VTVVVSDTSPLNYLILIDAVDLLPRLFSEVLIPPAVASELARMKAPARVRAWIESPPSWLRTKAPAASPRSLGLGEGETEAIFLAKELGILLLLIDERKGFHAAEALGLEPIGLLGILELSAYRNWIDFDDHIQRLRGTSFRFHERLIVEAKNRLSKR
jgi:predicted nucleic acid-binding protein